MSAQAAEAQPIADSIDDAVDETREAIEDSAPVVVAGDERDEMPLPTEPRTIFLGGLFTLALLTALYAASEIVLPVVL